ncbi:hypothetical protein CBM2587_A10130 [Cupriavidus taiwanensis]|uniref:Uncharacterized protein n=1 Tax=Cupriavidus taiwanensis TaxID=164546 RepID=A0A375BBK8_9BURK|nr:hypothetical protein CBM2587_A10130 [Cupriavidus taiwanensis]
MRPVRGYFDIRCALLVDLDRTRSFELTPRRDFPVRAEPPRPARFFLVQARQKHIAALTKKAASRLPFSMSHQKTTMRQDC